MKLPEIPWWHKTDPAPPAPKPRQASYGDVDPQKNHPIPLAMQAPVELDHDLIVKALAMIGREAHRQARASGFWVGLDPAKPADLWGKLALVVEELAEAGRALREGRLTTTKRLATQKEIEKEGIVEVDEEGAVDEVADIVLRCADTCTAANLDLGAAIVRKIYKNRRRPYGHGGRAF